MANTFTFSGQTLTDADIFGGINFLHDLNTGEEFGIGNTASASVRFVTDKQLPLYSKDAVNGTFTWTKDGVSRGRYYITEVKKASGKYEVTAYDAMILLDTSVTALSLTYPLSVATAASAIATFIGCTTQGTINNGTAEAADGTIEDTVTCRQLLGWVAEASGCSVKIDGNDHICFMYYASSGITVTASDFVEYGLDVADYTCAAIDNVTICDISGLTAASAGAGTNSLFIQGNPFLYEATSTEASVILGCVSSFVYAPFTCEMFEENGLEVGTTATFGSVTTLVMHIESSENGAVASAVGSDTRAELNKSLDIMVNEAMATAKATNLHFWYTASGADAGVHIAEVDKTSFDITPSGGNVRIDSDSLDIRNGLTEIAKFGNLVRIGKEDDARIELNTYGMTAISSDGAPYFSVLSSGANIRQEVMWTPISVAYAESATANFFKTWDIDELIDPTVWASLQPGDEFNIFAWAILHARTSSVSPTERVMGTYKLSCTKGTDASMGSSNLTTYSYYLKYDSSTDKVVFGTKNTLLQNYYMSGQFCQMSSYSDTPAPYYAIGANMQETGNPLGVAFGNGTIPCSNGIAMGTYNEEDLNDTCALIIGNGSDDSSRSNALTVDWDGNVDAAGSVISDTNYADAWADTGQGYEVSGINLAGSTYLGQAIDLGAIGDKKPIFNGFDISGTGTARIHTLGHYIYKDNGHWYAYIKMRNDNTSAVNGFSVTAYIAWI